VPLEVPDAGFEEDAVHLQKRMEDLLAEDGRWEDIAPLARRFLAMIGTGRVDASASQVTALKEIIGRAEGRVGQQRADEKPLGILVLPALVGADSFPFVALDEGDVLELSDG
jgi:hypothetical protein